MLMCLFALATGHTDMESFCEMSEKKGKNADNCVMAIGMATQSCVCARIQPQRRMQGCSMEKRRGILGPSVDGLSLVF